MLTFAMVKGPAAKECSTTLASPDLVNYLNEAQDRLMQMGKWRGTYQKYRFCVSDGCITLPREVETIESIAVSGKPGTVRNQWFEFLESGPGPLTSTDCVGVQVIDRGLVPAFDDVRGANKKLAVYADKTEAAGAIIVLQFFNSAGQWVRTQQGGEWADGEAIVIPAAGAYAYTTNLVAPNGLKAIIKPVTNGVIRLYEYDTVTTGLRPLGYYDPTERTPEYRRVFIPDFTNLGCGSCENVTVDAMVKLKHVPITGRDNDRFIIGSLGALKLACKALRHEEANNFQEAAVSWGAARNVLDQELRNYLGDGAVQPIRIESPETFGAAVGNII